MQRLKVSALILAKDLGVSLIRLLLPQLLDQLKVQQLVSAAMLVNRSQTCVEHVFLRQLLQMQTALIQTDVGVVGGSGVQVFAQYLPQVRQKQARRASLQVEHTAQSLQNTAQTPARQLGK